MTGYAQPSTTAGALLQVGEERFRRPRPVIGALLLTYLFIKSLVDWSDPANSYSGASWFGFAPPAVIGVGFLLLGAMLLLAGGSIRRNRSSSGARRSPTRGCWGQRPGGGRPGRTGKLAPDPQRPADGSAGHGHLDPDLCSGLSFQPSRSARPTGAGRIDPLNLPRAGDAHAPVRGADQQVQVLHRLAHALDGDPQFQSGLAGPDPAAG